MSTHAEVVNVSSRAVERSLKKFMQANSGRGVKKVDSIYLTCHVFAGNLEDFIREQPKGVWVIYVPCCNDVWSRRGLVAYYLESTGEGKDPLEKCVRYRFGRERDTMRDVNVRGRVVKGTERSLKKRF